MQDEFLYLVAVMDWATRRVLVWRLSNIMDTEFRLDALTEALQRYGTPEIFNTDHGSQFTSIAFTAALEAAGVRSSMDGRGRCLVSEGDVVHESWNYPQFPQDRPPFPGPYPPFTAACFSRRRGELTTNGLHFNVPLDLSGEPGPPSRRCRCHTYSESLNSVIGGNTRTILGMGICT